MKDFATENKTKAIGLLSTRLILISIEFNSLASKQNPSHFEKLQMKNAKREHKLLKKLLKQIKKVP